MMSLSSPSVVFDRSRMRMQTFSPHLPGTVDTRKSIGFASILTLSGRPGQPFFGDVEAAQYLNREINPSCTRFGSFCTPEAAVYAEADGHVSFHWLDVVFAGALFNGKS